MMSKNNNWITTNAGLKRNAQLQLHVIARIRNFNKCAFYVHNIVIYTKKTYNN